VTPENKERIRLNLIDYITGTVDEWLRMAHFDQTPEDKDGIQYRISWEHPADGAMIANVKENQYTEPLARFGVQIIVDTLPDLPPIGPENDLGVYGIDEGASAAYCYRCSHEHYPPNPCVCGCVDLLTAAPEWLPATFADCIIGDRVRLGQEETTVRDTNTLLWHARNREWTDDAGKTRDHQTPWEHTVLRMDLEANPGMHEYPAGTACEILCDAERKAFLLLQQGFPGSSVVSS
jgi:hypothetical protein